MKGSPLVAGARLSKIRKLTEVSRALTYAASLDEVFQLTVDRAVDLVAGEKALFMVAAADGLLALRSSHGVDPALTERLQAPLDESLVPHLTRVLGVPPESFLGVPVVVAGAIKGILVVIRPATTAGVEEDEWLLSALADQAAAALEKTRLDEVAEFREQLIGVVGHDLRNPLNTVVMAAQLLLLHEGLGEKETELARKIARGAAQATRLIQQLLDLTRSRLGGGIPIEPEPVDINDVCREIVSETELKHPDRPLHLEVRGDSTGVWDRDRMSQLLANLVGNAVAHGEPRTPIELRIDGEQTEVVIQVVNRGKPIPLEMLPFIFDAFRRDRAPDASRTGGLGLGLFIAQQIAVAHGGSIGVTSSEKDGTAFRVRLPRRAAD